MTQTMEPTVDVIAELTGVLEELMDLSPERFDQVRAQVAAAHAELDQAREVESRFCALTTELGEFNDNGYNHLPLAAREKFVAGLEALLVPFRTANA